MSLANRLALEDKIDTKVETSLADVADEKKSLTSESSATTYLFSGQDAFSKKQYQQSIVFFTRAACTADEEHEQEILGYATHLLGHSYLTIKNYAIAIQKLEKAKRIAQSLKDDNLLASVLLDLGHCYEKKAENHIRLNERMAVIQAYSQAEQYLHSAHKLFDAPLSSLRKKIVDADLNLGHCLRKLGNSPKAIQYLHNALGNYSTYIECKEYVDIDCSTKASIHYELGIAHLALCQYSGAAKHLNIAFDIFPEFKNKLNAGYFVFLAHLSTKKWPEAIETLVRINNTMDKSKGSTRDSFFAPELLFTDFALGICYALSAHHLKKSSSSDSDTNAKLADDYFKQTLANFSSELPKLTVAEQRELITKVKQLLQTKTVNKKILQQYKTYNAIMDVYNKHEGIAHFKRLG